MTESLILGASVTDHVSGLPRPASALRVVTLPRGLLGFEDCKRYSLERDPVWDPLAKLRSLDQPHLAFVIAPPRFVVPDYHVAVERYEIAELELQQATDAEIWVIVTVPEDPRDMSANLQGPLIISRITGIGKQLVLARSQYSTRHAILADQASEGRDFAAVGSGRRMSL